MELTLSQRIDRAEAAIDCEKLQSMHCYLLAGAIHREELMYLWCDRDDITFAHSYGQYNNRANYWDNYVLRFEANGLTEFVKTVEAYPEIRKHQPNYMKYGLCSMHTLPSPVIEVAEDAMSVKACFYTMAVLSSRFSSYGLPFLDYSYERYGLDFLKEDGEWKFLNMRICSDLVGSADEYNWPLARDISEAFPDSSFMEFDVPGPLHFNYSPIRPPQTTPGLPVPYKTFSETFSYADVKTLER